jgi:diaminopropionate ammonia-lyase
MRRLRDAVDDDVSIEAGASGSAALGGLMALVGDPALASARASLELGPASRALILVTEGITDPSHDRTLSANSSGTSEP